MKSIFTLSALMILMASCQKEISDESGTDPGGGGGGTGTGTRLYRIGMKSGTDSVTIDYTYNSNARMTDYKLIGTDGGQSVDETIKYVRSSWNVITQEIYKSSSLAQYGLTEVVTNHTYDDVTNTYKLSLTKLNIPGYGQVSDSVVYTYDATRRLTSLIDYVNDGSGYVPSSKEEYTYSGNNVATVNYYEYDEQSGTYALDMTETYEYDNKANPLLFASEAVVLRSISNFATFYSSNNYTKLTVSGTSGSGTITRTYTYNSNNHPLTAVSTGATTRNLTYYYQ